MGALRQSPRQLQHPADATRWRSFGAGRPLSLDPPPDVHGSDRLQLGRRLGRRVALGLAGSDCSDRSSGNQGFARGTLDARCTSGLFGLPRAHSTLHTGSPLTAARATPSASSSQIVVSKRTICGRSKVMKDCAMDIGPRPAPRLPDDRQGRGSSYTLCDRSHRRTGTNLRSCPLTSRCASRV
jgi:hypothetical protein